MTMTANDLPLVDCSCGCGRPVNYRHREALAMRERGMTVEEIADELDTSQGSTSTLLKQAQTGTWPRRIRGHAKGRPPPPDDPSTRAARHVHQYRQIGQTTIGGVTFHVDQCGCSTRRARRPEVPPEVLDTPR